MLLCVFMPFDATEVAKQLASGAITLFMGVPTIYVKLTSTIEAQPAEQQAQWKSSVQQNVRLMVCGSAALPVPTLDRFRAISGHTLLERYGMTEIGMALSQPLLPVHARLPGTVGMPFPGVETRVLRRTKASDESGEAAEESEPSTAHKDEYEQTGELLVRGPTVFHRYWKNPKSTREAFLSPVTASPFPDGQEDGEWWFATGDTVGLNRRDAPADPVPDGKKKPLDGPTNFSILGRTSVDIIKRSGFKISALEIESAFLEARAAEEIAVVGVPHPVMGERIIAILVLPSGMSYSQNKSEADAVVERLKAVATQRLAYYKCPSEYRIVDRLPRNAMGKINKKDLKKQLGLA